MQQAFSVMQSRTCARNGAALDLTIQKIKRRILQKINIKNNCFSHKRCTIQIDLMDKKARDKSLALNEPELT